jgi:hypothetical protein
MHDHIYTKSHRIIPNNQFLLALNLKGIGEFVEIHLHYC